MTFNIFRSVFGQRQKKIWIDLDNSPHVPFFVPIIEELERRGYSVVVTARDCFQVCQLANLYKVRYERIGHHYGKSMFLKLAGLCMRALQLAPTIIREKPDLALSHGSRSQVLLSAFLRIPSVVICDYEFVKGLTSLHPNYVMFPEVIPVTDNKVPVLRYPGIKEDVYVPRFRPDPSIRTTLGMRDDDLVVILRPPANEAHYHNPASDILLSAVLNLLGRDPAVKVILLPRNDKQAGTLRRDWAAMFTSGKMIIPEYAVDGLNLIWHSDLVISGGGTMNREAAALGVPVYSIFRGKIGAVDRYLETSGRLTMIDGLDDVQTKIAIQRRDRSMQPGSGNAGTLEQIVNNVARLVEPGCVATAPATDAHQIATSTVGEVNIPELIRQALNSLVQMFNAERGLFCYKLRQNHTGLLQEGISRRYTLMTLLGLHRSEAADYSSPVNLQDVLNGLLCNVTWIDNTGDLGLLLWATAVISPERLGDHFPAAKIRSLLNQCRDIDQGRTMETAWFLSGLAHAVLVSPEAFGDVADLAWRSHRILQKTQGPYGTFGHLARNGSLSGYFRGRIGSFADQVYPIYALSKFAQAYRATDALAMAKNCADAICRLQGPQGQWWWHYDALTGKIAEKYPVYSVHQEGMAPMALFELQEQASLDYNDAIYKGLDWISGKNELARDLRHTSGLVWRCILPKSKFTVFWMRAQDALGYKGDADYDSRLTTLLECRPYELGWLLYAFAGRSSQRLYSSPLTATPQFANPTRGQGAQAAFRVTSSS
jgi:uncharacterized protein